jgi:Ran GTPase-activating protein (RanGAP) involved in mRNA processing and transport
MYFLLLLFTTNNNEFHPMSDFDFDMETVDANSADSQLNSSGGPGRTSKYEPIAQTYDEEVRDTDQAISLSDLSQNDVQNIRNLLYNRFGKEQVIVRSSQNEDESYDAVVRDREGDEYLRDSDSTNGTSETSDSDEEMEEDIDEDVAEEVDGVF